MPLSEQNLDCHISAVGVVFVSNLFFLVMSRVAVIFVVISAILHPSNETVDGFVTHKNGQVMHLNFSTQGILWQSVLLCCRKNMPLSLLNALAFGFIQSFVFQVSALLLHDTEDLSTNRCISIYLCHKLPPSSPFKLHHIWYREEKWLWTL